MPNGNSKDGNPGHLERSPNAKQRYAWKERVYPVPTSSRKQFRWKASALRGLQKFNRASVPGHPATIVVPALYNFLPAEGLALGWLNDIDSLHTIRQRIIVATKLTGWDVFTFHTQHNLDSYFDSTIAAVRDTWLREGSLNAKSVTETVKRFGRAYEYHHLDGRLVENLVFQSALMEWLSSHAENVPFRFHVVGTALLSGLVWSRSLTFENAATAAGKIGTCWNGDIAAMAEDELKRTQSRNSDEDLGWMRFYRVRQIIEGRATLSLATCSDTTPHVEAPARPFYYSASAKDEPVLIQTVQDVRAALDSMNLASWAPEIPKPIPNDSIRGWLVSATHPIATTCRWSVYNYLLATPAAGQLFLDHILPVGGHFPIMDPNPECFRNVCRYPESRSLGPDW